MLVREPWLSERLGVSVGVLERRWDSVLLRDSVELRLMEGVPLELWERLWLGEGVHEVDGEAGSRRLWLWPCN